MKTCGDYGGQKEDGSPCRRRAGWGTGSAEGPCRDHQPGTQLEEQAQRQRAFLGALITTAGNRTRAAAAVGIDRTTHYTWLEQPAYKAAFEVALRMAADVLEDEAIRRGRDGVRKYLFHQGRPVADPTTGQPYYELEYSDTLLIFLLKAANPEKYRERFDHRVAGSLEHRGAVTIYMPDNQRERGPANRLAPLGPPEPPDGNGTGNGRHG